MPIKKRLSMESVARVMSALIFANGPESAAAFGRFKQQFEKRPRRKLLWGVLALALLMKRVLSLDTEENDHRQRVASSRLVELTSCEEAACTSRNRRFSSWMRSSVLTKDSMI